MGVDEIESWLAQAYPRAYRTACLLLKSPADAEDAVQEAFLRVWRFRNAIPGGDGRQAWLYRVVVNACSTRRRGERGPRERDGDEPLVGALDRLPEDLRLPLVLRYYSGLAEKDIAIAIQRRPATVRSRLAEGRRRLAQDAALAESVLLEVAE